MWGSCLLWEDTRQSDLRLGICIRKRQILFSHNCSGQCGEWRVYSQVRVGVLGLRNHIHQSFFSSGCGSPNQEKTKPRIKARFMSKPGHLQCHKNLKNSLFFKKELKAQGMKFWLTARNLMGSGSKPRIVYRSIGLSFPILVGILWASLHLQSPTGPRSFPRINRKLLNGEMI